jgi:hypothetical protein
MFRAAACAGAGRESNSYTVGKRRGVWINRAPQSIFTVNVQKKGDSPKEKVYFLWGPQRAIPFKVGDPQRTSVLQVVLDLFITVHQIREDMTLRFQKAGSWKLEVAV